MTTYQLVNSLVGEHVPLQSENCDEPGYSIHVVYNSTKIRVKDLSQI